MDAEVQHIASFLCVDCSHVTINADTRVPCLQVENGLQVKGLATAVKLLVKKSQKPELLGRTPEEQALVNQWLEYRVNQVDRVGDEKDVLTILQELNGHMSDRVFLAGFSLTVADVILYIALHDIVSNLPFYKKQKFIHLSRWFDYVQHLPNVRQKLSNVVFQRNLIYTDGSH